MITRNDINIGYSSWEGEREREKRLDATIENYIGILNKKEEYLLDAYKAAYDFVAITLSDHKGILEIGVTFLCREEGLVFPIDFFKDFENAWDMVGETELVIKFSTDLL